MPGFYADGEYDIAGFIVGVVDQSKIIDGRDIRPGDALVGLPSAGLHTNGYSLARKLLLDTAHWTVDTEVPILGITLGDELLKPHLNYEPVLRPALERNLVLGLAHITGGGITDNLPRILPEGCGAQVRFGSWPVLPVFDLMSKIGNVVREEMLRATNMGIGMIAVHPARPGRRVRGRDRHGTFHDRQRHRRGVARYLRVMRLEPGNRDIGILLSGPRLELQRPSHTISRRVGSMPGSRSS